MTTEQISLAVRTLPSFSLDKAFNFAKFCNMARSTIEIQTKDISVPPVALPTNPSHCNVELLISRCMKQTSEITRQYWSIFNQFIWDLSPLDMRPSDEDIVNFNHFGLPLQTSYRHLYPSTRVCLDPTCTHYRQSNTIKTLDEIKTFKGSLFSLREGALPVYTSSLYCRGCKRRYHNNYSVHASTNTRNYYGGVPEVVQASMHFFIESAMLEYFGNALCFAWVSSNNGARIYNRSMATHHAYILNNKRAFLNSFDKYFRPPPPWAYSLKLRDKYLLDGFLLYSLLLDAAEEGFRLYLPHDEASQRNALKAALEARNKRMQGIGQEAYTHACDLCCEVKQDNGQDKNYRVAVCDGNTIGHPCCAQHNCQNPLVSHRHRFCAEHQHLDRVCAVAGCDAPVDGDNRTCQDQQHRAFETVYFTQGKALGQLRHRLKQAGHAGEDDSPSVDSGNVEPDPAGIVEEESVLCDKKAESGNRKLKALFGRRRTHNEQLMVRPCGVILSRATFFGAESISSVNIFAKATFPTPESTPEALAFDNNCSLLAHQNHIGEKHFAHTALPVDVFHFKTKHKVTDLHCQRNCNPAAFPELMKDGKWRFNLSVCEQTFTWLGPFQPIVRDMEVTRFNFFLDEMIKRRNRYTIEQLASRDLHVRDIPIATLFPN